MDFPNKKYEIIYADPPWDYSCVGKNFDSQFTKGKNKFDPVVCAKDHYPTMSPQELMNLPVKNIAADNCLLYIWITNPHIDIGMDIIKGWGFKYSTVAFVWYKHATNPGFYTMSECELCFVAKRGSIPKPRGSRNIRQLISEKRSVHSRKPTEAKKRIELMHPTQSKIELFSREYRDGWDCWGLETGKLTNVNPFKI